MRQCCWEHWSHTGVTLESHWSHTGIILESHWSHTGVTMESHWSHTGVTLESHWSHTGVTMESHWSHTGATLESQWSHTGVTLESHWSHTGVTLSVLMLAHNRAPHGPRCGCGGFTVWAQFVQLQDTGELKFRDYDLLPSAGAATDMFDFILVSDDHRCFLIEASTGSCHSLLRVCRSFDWKLLLLLIS
ncbi:unnamed protein product [Pleuronectes platessa]|uniref:Uncharacterized protein n=1 Tax=Pleuronectes platessa TaxID=8262 RepID=A0A9N7Z5X2_PLEPL|nr:unnamed protein product [Pleuronectes platessa]